MAAGTILVPEVTALNDWQLLKKPTVAQTAYSAADLTENFRDLQDTQPAGTTVEALDVSIIGALRFQIWGEGAANDDPIIDLYGWSDGGPGCHIGKVTTTLGNFVSTGGAAADGFHKGPTTHQSIRDAFAAATSYRGCDTYVETNDYESAITVYANEETDFPAAGIDVTFVNSQYQYFIVLVTALDSATNVGAIFKALSIKRGYRNPQATG